MPIGAKKGGPSRSVFTGNARKRDKKRGRSPIRRPSNHFGLKARNTAEPRSSVASEKPDPRVAAGATLWLSHETRFTIPDSPKNGHIFAAFKERSFENHLFVLDELKQNIHGRRVGEDDHRISVLA
jgi:hypothetical protein